MKSAQQIEFLEAFIVQWNLMEDDKDRLFLKTALDVFCMNENLPKMSADDLIIEIKKSRSAICEALYLGSIDKFLVEHDDRLFIDGKDVTDDSKPFQNLSKEDMDFIYRHWKMDFDNRLTAG